MSYLDEVGLGQLWGRIDAVFARLTEAGGSLSFANGVLSLISISGNNTLDSENLDDRYPTKDQAAASLEVSNGRLYIKDVKCNHNDPEGGIDLARASGAALSLGISGKRLYLKDKDGHEIQNSSVTLP